MNIKSTYSGIAMLILGAGMTMTSCKKEPEVIVDPAPEYTVPATYNFDNVEYAEASGTMSMWAGLSSYLGKSTSRKLSQDTANYLWNNTNTAFTAEIGSNLPHSVSDINAFSFNVSGKTSDASIIKQYIDSMVVVSQSYTATASNGVAGKVGTRLVNYSGLEFNQVVAKGLMGAMQMVQIFSYLDKSTTADNNTVIAGSGTAMQHNWDMAFGFMAVPKDYDTSKSYANTEANRPLALGGYFRERGQYIKSGGAVYEAFRRGRAAINNKHNAGRDAAITTIKLNVEKTLAAAAYAYLTLPQGSSDMAVKFHALSEGYGFLLGLKFRPSTSPLSAADYTTLMSIINTNFYELAADASNTKLKQAQTILTGAYGQLQP